MGLIAGYTNAFLSAGQVKLVTVASNNDAAIAEVLVLRFGAVEVLSRTGLDQRTLDLMKLRPGECIEWVQVARR